MQSSVKYFLAVGSKLARVGIAVRGIRGARAPAHHVGTVRTPRQSAAGCGFQRSPRATAWDVDPFTPSSTSQIYITFHPLNPNHYIV